MDRSFRITGLRVVLALFIVMMTASINPALANDTGSGTPSGTQETTETPPVETTVPDTEVPTQVAMEVPTNEPTTEPTMEPTESPATEVPTEAPADIPTETPPADSTPASTQPESRIQSLVVETSNVTLTVRSTNPGVARTLPADATWSVSLDGSPIATDTFATEDLALPQAIPVDDPVPYVRTQ